MGAVRIEVGVRVAVVRAVVARPPEDRALDGAGSCDRVEELEERVGVVGSV